MITQSQRRKALKALDQLEAGVGILRNKLKGRLALAQLDDAVAHCELLRDLVEDVASPVRSARWRTQTTER